MSKNHHKNCLECKKAFQAKNLRAIYCSDKCRVRSNRRKSVTVTENGDLLLSKEEILLKETKLVLEQKQNELLALTKKLEDDEIIKKNRDSQKQKDVLAKTKLINLRNQYTQLHGKRKSGGSVSNAILSNAKDSTGIMFGLVGVAIDNLISNKTNFFDYSIEIKEINNQLEQIAKSRKPFILSGLPNYIIDKKNILIKSIDELTIRCTDLEKEISKKNNSKDLNQLKDENGFVTAKDVKNINFSDRITLSDDLGIFIGALEKNKCAITLTGKQGSGKTYFSFDLISKFIKLNYKVAYFSCEEGITQLTKEKIESYNLQNEANFKIREEANLETIQKFANDFDVMVIDSWGKLNADINEFDKLRITFPNTIFVSIFQLTTSGQMRGGTMAAFDAGINIETSIVDGKRIAICTKNRYGKTGIKYFTDDRKIEEI
ncbi:MAG: AAA family ATPase [Bacteroidota bacterium]